jgi:BirA family biotin operon repressor/biotin-[acetyl-CoA-carboxylase] ligase
MSMRYRLIELRADGGFHSGQSLGRRLGISRAAVWKHIKTLDQLGLEVHAVRGRGYRLAEPFEPLDSDVIMAQLSASLRSRIQTLEVLSAVDSTSDHLRREPESPDSAACRVCLAEWQSAGRGRRGRRWISPYGSNLYLSLAARVNETTLGAGGLSLAVAIAVAEALQGCGLQGAGLKWPNDIYLQGRKLAGILLDLSGESGGPYSIVIGVGINLKIPAAAAHEIDQPWADLSQSGITVNRNRLSALIISSLVHTLERFNEHGLRAFIKDWERLDLVSGRAVELHHEHNPMITGIARGIDSRGALLIEHNGTTRSYHAGEVSLRLS